MSAGKAAAQRLQTESAATCHVKCAVDHAEGAAGRARQHLPDVSAAYDATMPRAASAPFTVASRSVIACAAHSPPEEGARLLAADRQPAPAVPGEGLLPRKGAAVLNSAPRWPAAERVNPEREVTVVAELDPGMQSAAAFRS